ncbi:YSIRK-type signal peptide-containing protein, partial [Lactobacillus crispatus]|uniref:YSIRK-type signal peptide-containing protein n=1 Tax=Lactobacillus crispatus TaxID=47770 RepID=UPI0018E37F12
MKYFRNDKLDLVNKEKQRFGFRKLSSGKIASVLLGVTIFGSFALNGQVVKADTTTDGSQKSAVVDEAKNRQTDEEEQFRQDASAQKDSGSHSSLTITRDNLGGEETTEADQGKQDTQTADKTADTTSGSEAKTGKTQIDSTGIDTQNPNRRGTTSDKNGAGAAARAIRTRALVLVQLAIPKDDKPTAQEQPTAAQLVDFYKGKVSGDGADTELDLKHAQSLLDYYNNLETVTKILNLDASSYGEGWLEQVIGKKGGTISNQFVDLIVTGVSKKIVTDTQVKIDAQIEKLEQLAEKHPNNQEIQNAINNLRDAKNSVTVDNITNAKAMENAIGTLDNYGSQSAYNKLKQDAEKVNKDDLQSAVNEAATVKAANSQASEDKQKAYQDAIAAGQNVLNDGKASQA